MSDNQLATSAPLAVAVGTFDGVHIGHRSLINELGRHARSLGLRPAVVTFSPHPLAILHPGSEPPMLATPELRRQLLLECGVEKVIELPFTPALASLTTAQFLEFLARYHSVRHLLVGFNTIMGSDRVYNLDDFRKIASPLGISVDRASEFAKPDAGCMVCSSSIRRLLAEGNVNDAATLLGRVYMLTGSVVHGNNIGHTLGYPTANISPCPGGQQIPAPGVYACRVSIDDAPDDKHDHISMVNIGTRPTVAADGRQTIEAHLFGFNGNLYDHTLTIQFVERIRDEQRFDSVDSLRRQLEADAILAKKSLSKDLPE